MSRKYLLTAVIAAAIASGSTAQAALVYDVQVNNVPESGPVFDNFLPTYTGPRVGDLDAFSSEVTLNTVTGTLAFTGTMTSPIGTTAGAFYVWGVNRGAGTERFVNGTPSVGAGVRFDSVVVLRPDGSGQVNNLLTGVNSVLTAGSVIISGSTISSVPLPISLFPSTGFEPVNYTWNLWPRVSTVTGNAAISDFLPDASNAPLTIVPEPASLAVLCAVTLVMARRKRRPTVTR